MQLSSINFTLCYNFFSSSFQIQFFFSIWCFETLLPFWTTSVLLWCRRWWFWRQFLTRASPSWNLPLWYGQIVGFSSFFVSSNYLPPNFHWFFFYKYFPLILKWIVGEHSSYILPLLDTTFYLLNWHVVYLVRVLL